MGGQEENKKLYQLPPGVAAKKPNAGSTPKGSAFVPNNQHDYIGSHLDKDALFSQYSKDLEKPMV